jgi:NAD(P)-dependent dehydrogenase (short-subunit alcohol dehydrogenase family)
LTPQALEGTILVSGGTGALGQAVLAELAESGAEVTSTWRSEAERDAVAEAFGAKVGLVEADLSTDEGAEAAVKAAAANGPLAGLVNLVGGFAAGGRWHEEPIATLEKMLALNLLTTARMCRAALPSLLEGGGGTIVCVGAKHALEPFPTGGAVSISKAAVLALVRALDVEYRSDGVRVNTVLPNLIDTPANRKSDPDADTSTWVSPEEIARVIGFLSSPASAPVSGALIPVYGKS